MAPDFDRLRVRLVQIRTKPDVLAEEHRSFADRCGLPPESFLRTNAITDPLTPTLLDDADAHARGLARSLVPVELEQNGLESALGGLAARATALYGTAVHTETTGTGPADASALHADAATNLFWIAQEAVSNAIQHGRAATVRVALVRGADRLRLRIEDDGIGFEAAAQADDDRATDQRGMGLRIMTYRARLAGGTLDIRPGAEGGAVVTCTVPLRSLGFLSPAP